MGYCSVWLAGVAAETEGRKYAGGEKRARKASHGGFPVLALWL